MTLKLYEIEKYEALEAEIERLTAEVKIAYLAGLREHYRGTEEQELRKYDAWCAATAIKGDT